MTRIMTAEQVRQHNAKVRKVSRETLPAEPTIQWGHPLGPFPVPKSGPAKAPKARQRDPGAAGGHSGRGGRKYHNVPTVVDGIRFDSKKEASRYVELKLLEKAGIIRKLKPKPVYSLVVNRKWICDFIPDFIYEVRDGPHLWRYQCSDAKGMTTGGAYRLFRIKADLLEALHGIRTVETAT